MVPSPYLSAKLGRETYLKLENMQATGAFKLRGAMNAMASVPVDAPGVTCCSTGNHGRAVAFAARGRGLRAVICMSSLVPAAKVAGIRDLGAEARIVGRSQDDAQREADRLVSEEGFAEVHPFDDPAVIAGQGTIGLEMLEAVPDLATIVVPLSGGGLAGGIAVAAKAINPRIRVIGVSMDRGAAMHASIRAGRPVEVEEVESLADSLGGGIGMRNRHTLALCRDLLDETILVTEEDIYGAMQALYHEDRIVAEGACATGIAAMLSGRIECGPGPVATVITGRNLDMETFTRVVTGMDVALGERIVRGKPHVA